MSFTESEELNKWIHRSYEIGKREERERIIKLLVELKSENLLPEQAISKGWKFDEPTGIWWLPQDVLIELIDGVTK